MKKITKLIAFLSLKKVIAIEPNPPQWNSQKVKIFTPGQTDAQEILDNIHKEVGGHEPTNNGQFSDSRYALFFKQGSHDVNVDVGYYTTVHGLGRTPKDTTLATLICQNGGFQIDVGALDNFWRGAENVRVVGNMTWAVSQASPLRRLMIEGNLQLSQRNAPNKGSGYASGGFMADSTITGKIKSGSQQQFMSRNTFMSQWETGNWNMVFVGNQNSPAYHCGKDQGQIPATTIEETPIIIEKPYIVLQDDKFSLMVPKLEINKIGPTLNYENAEEIAFENVYVASENDSVQLINQKLDEGLHLILQPGLYKLNETIKVNNKNTVILGIGIATLISQNGLPCIEVANVEGVKISGILLQAGELETHQLLKWGDGTFEGSSSNPGAIHDIYARVGGPDMNEVKAQIMIQINSGNVIIDNVWLWRADHSVKGVVKNMQNPVQTALQINGDNVTGYGLACEHTLGNLLEWNGENGRTYFYQSEFPYDVNQSYGDIGYASYKVGENVKNHEAWGVGVYQCFTDYDVQVQSAILAPETQDVKFHNSLSVFLHGNGEIHHIINQDGNQVSSDNKISYDCEWSGNLPNFNDQTQKKQSNSYETPVSFEIIQ